MVPVPVNRKDPNVILPKLSMLLAYSPQGVVGPLLVLVSHKGRENDWVATAASGPDVCQNQLRTKVDAVVAEPFRVLTKAV